eukprot:2853588-Amphidinium_carterae.2
MTRRWRSSSATLTMTQAKPPCQKLLSRSKDIDCEANNLHAQRTLSLLHLQHQRGDECEEAASYSRVAGMGGIVQDDTQTPALQEELRRTSRSVAQKTRKHWCKTYSKCQQRASWKSGQEELKKLSSRASSSGVTCCFIVHPWQQRQLRNSGSGSRNKWSTTGRESEGSSFPNAEASEACRTAVPLEE